MPRAKRISDEVYNVRRRAERAAKRLGENISELIGQSYKGVTGAYQKGAIEALESYAKRKSISSQRKNKVFSEELRKLSKPSERETSSLTSGSEVRDATAIAVFYQSTRQAWEGKDPERRNEYIVEALSEYGVYDLQAAWDFVMDRNADALARVDQGYESTAEDAFEADDTNFKYDSNVLNYVISALI